MVSEYHKETAPVFVSIAESVQAPLSFAKQEGDIPYKTDLLGKYQVRNIRGVLEVIRLLKEFQVSDTHIGEGLKSVVQNTGLMGRWQLLGDAPRVICDLAHNREGIAEVMEQLSGEKYQRLHMVLGFVNDKDLGTMLPLFPKKATYYFARPDIPRGLDAEKLQNNAARYGLSGKSFSSVSKAYQAALKAADTGDLIFIGGSTFTVAEVV